MRDDMFKVIVERPRLVNSNGYSRDGRHYRNSEEVPSHLGMKRGYGSRKYLNENLEPLRRYLASQVNRPWDKVYSEICATIDARSTVKQHVLQHIEDFVALDTDWVQTPDGGKVVVRGWRWSKQHRFLEDSNFQLFVHPRTGILLRNRRWVSYDARRREQLRQGALRPGRRVLSEREQLHLVEGVWYHVTLANLPAARMQATANGHELVYDACWDVLRKEWVTRQHVDQPRRRPQANTDEVYGSALLYAVAKRQLGSREIRKHGLSGYDAARRTPRYAFHARRVSA
jgi:hypothetical protein